MAVKVLPQTVADAFVKQYYLILNTYPEKAHKFYQEPSILGWPGPEGVVSSVTSLSGINDKIMSSPYKNCTVEIKSRDSQGSLDGGIIIVVTGSMIGKDNVKRNFCQTFFLAKQEKGFYILNDILRFIDVAITVANTDAVKDLPAPSVQSSGIEDGKNKEELDRSISQDTVAEGAETSSLAASEEKLRPNEKVQLTIATASKKKRRSAAKNSKKKVRSAVAPEVNEKVHSSVEPVSNEEVQSTLPPTSDETVPSVVEPAFSENLPEVAAEASTQNQNEKLPSPVPKEKATSVLELDSNEKLASVDAAASNVTQKITYASMVAKEAPAISPRTVRVITNVSKHRAPSPVAKESTPAGKDAPKSTAYTGIYIGGLPYKITKQGIINVVKKFGPVRRKPDNVQIRRHEDGFCCGFVEFESADAARRAVEAHRVTFGETEAYIAVKRSSAYRGNEARGRSPSYNRTSPDKGQLRHHRRGRP